MTELKDSKALVVFVGNIVGSVTTLQELKPIDRTTEAFFAIFEKASLKTLEHPELPSEENDSYGFLAATLLEFRNVPEAKLVFDDPESDLIQ